MRVNLNLQRIYRMIFFDNVILFISIRQHSGML
jgi:hypothetical protein